MFVQNVMINSLNFLRIEIVETSVKIERNYWHFLSNQNCFRLTESCGVELEGSSSVSLIYQPVITIILPTGPVIAAIFQKHIQKCVGVVVISNPTRSGDVAIQA